MTTNPNAICSTCGHPNDMHGNLSGCTATLGNGRGADFCPCATFDPLPTQAPGGTIPARNTDPDTSHKASRAVVVKAGTQRTLLLAGFGDFGTDGATDEEAAEAAEGVSLTSEFAKRASELREGGFIATTGEERKGHAGLDRMVSAITDKGYAALEGLGHQRPIQPRRSRSKLTDREANLVDTLRRKAMSGPGHPADRMVTLRETLKDVLHLIDRLS